jgi:tetratricopeptide (TPR) repeat protein
MPLSSPENSAERTQAVVGSGLAGRALLGWMGREQAVKFLMEDCLFFPPLTLAAAEAVWESRKAIVEALPPEEPSAARKLPLSAADLKAARKFRIKNPDFDFVVDFVRLNPMDLVVSQLWVSTAIADRYRDKVTPDKWLQTALLDPPSGSRLTSRSDGDTITFDLPHSEYFLTVPSQPNELRVAEADTFITVGFHADRALLLRGYHRTFACAQFVREAVNAPHGVLFAESNQLRAMGSLAEGVLSMMEGPRPPRMRDFFDDRFFLPVTLRRRRYQMRVHCEVAEIDDQAPDQSPGQSPEPSKEPSKDRTAAGQSPLPATPVLALPNDPDRGPNAFRNFEGISGEAARHLQAGRIDQAVALYECALFLRPDSAEVLNDLGYALLQQGRRNEAVTLLERAVVLNPGNARPVMNLGSALAAQGRIDEAAAHHQRALAIDPGFVEGHVHMGNVFASQGRFDDAMAAYGRAIAIMPDYAQAHYSRALVKKFHPGDADLTALEALAGREDLPADKALHAHFALAKAAEDCKDYGRAFSHLRRGNALKRRQINYDEAGAAKLVEQTCAAFDKSLFDRFEGEGDPSSVPIFVLGMPRSGSTLVEQILGAHPQIHTAGELTDLDQAAGSVLKSGGHSFPYAGCVPALTGVILRRIGRAYLSRLPAPAEGRTRIVDKLPGNFLLVGLIRLTLPNARIIHTMRDPVDTCVSCYSTLFSSGQDFCYDLAELGRHYRRYTEVMAHWRSVLPPGAMLDVAYEDVVDDLEGQARRLIDYCGLPWDDRCLDFHKNSGLVRTASVAQVRKPLYRSSLQKWRRYEADLGPLLEGLGDLVPAAVRATMEVAQPH